MLLKHDNSYINSKLPVCENLNSSFFLLLQMLLISQEEVKANTMSLLGIFFTQPAGENLTQNIASKSFYVGTKVPDCKWANFNTIQLVNWLLRAQHSKVSWLVCSIIWEYNIFDSIIWSKWWRLITVKFWRWSTPSQVPRLTSSRSGTWLGNP